MWEFIGSAFKQIFDVPPDTVLAYFLCLVAGILVNWVWKCKREKIDPINYWTKNPRSTVLSLLGAVATFITTMIIEPGLGKQTYFVMGIACDAMLNKPPLPASVQIALENASAQFKSTHDSKPEATYQESYDYSVSEVEPDGSLPILDCTTRSDERISN